MHTTATTTATTQKPKKKTKPKNISFVEMNRICSIYLNKGTATFGQERTALKPSATLCYTVQCTNNPSNIDIQLFCIALFFFKTPYILCGESRLNTEAYLKVRCLTYVVGLISIRVLATRLRHEKESSVRFSSFSGEWVAWQQ